MQGNMAAFLVLSILAGVQVGVPIRELAGESLVSAIAAYNRRNSKHERCKVT